MEVPVYLFTGFLEAGKTKFIQETLEDERFNKGDRTLLLLCEEGIEEYDPTRFSGKNVYIEVLEEESQLTAEKLEELRKKHDAERVMLEYNGMWQLKTLMEALPMEWPVYQIFLFFDATTFMNYNANMRSLVVDKLQLCDMVVFNRFTKDMDMLEYHKIARAVSRRVDIVYEFTDGSVVPDEIEDPLPFDVNAAEIELGDGDYALWYRDMSEDSKKYQGKIMRYKALAVKNAELSDGYFVVGRKLMTCCVDDIQFAALVAKNDCGYAVKTQEWVMIEAKLDIRFNKAYGGRGPVLLARSVTPTTPPEQEVATFY